MGEDDLHKMAGQGLHVTFPSDYLAMNNEQKSSSANHPMRANRVAPVSPYSSVAVEGQVYRWKYFRLGKHLTGASRRSDFEMTLPAERHRVNQGYGG